MEHELSGKRAAREHEESRERTRRGKLQLDHVVPREGLETTAVASSCASLVLSPPVPPDCSQWIARSTAPGAQRSNRPDMPFHLYHQRQRLHARLGISRSLASGKKRSEQEGDWNKNRAGRARRDNRKRRALTGHPRARTPEALTFPHRPGPPPTPYSRLPYQTLDNLCTTWYHPLRHSTTRTCRRKPS